MSSESTAGRGADSGAGSAGSDYGAGRGGDAGAFAHPAGHSGAAPDVAGVESVGLVAEGADPERLIREAEAAVGAAPADLSGQIEGQLAGQLRELTSWSQITGDGVDIIAVCMLPQWHLTDAERSRVAEKLARLLDLLVPVRMSPVVEAVVGLALTGGAICASRMMQHGGHLPPLGPAREPSREPAGKPTPPAREPEPLRPDQLTGLGV